MGKSGPSFRHGAVFGPKQCLRQKEARAMESPKCASLVGAKSKLNCAGPKTTTSHLRQYRVENENLGKFGPTFRHGEVFAPKQCLYQKEAKTMECLKMYSSSRCKKRTSLCVSANYPVSCNSVFG